MTERSTINAKNGSSQRASREPATKAARRAPPVSAEECERMIAVEAYFRAERRGFAPGHELEDWCEAEAEVRSRLDKNHS